MICNRTRFSTYFNVVDLNRLEILYVSDFNQNLTQHISLWDFIITFFLCSFSE